MPLDQALPASSLLAQTTSSQNAASATTGNTGVSVQHNDVLTAQQGILDFGDESNQGITWSISNDGPNGRALISPNTETREWLYAQRTTGVGISVANTVVFSDTNSSSMPAVKAAFEIFIPGYYSNTGATDIVLHPRVDGSAYCYVHLRVDTVGVQYGPVNIRIPVTLTAGVHSFGLQVDPGAVDSNFQAGAGGALANSIPIWMRVSRW